MKAVNEWKRILDEEGEPYFWMSIGASALLTALIVTGIAKYITSGTFFTL